MPAKYETILFPKRLVKLTVSKQHEPSDKTRAKRQPSAHLSYPYLQILKYENTNRFLLSFLVHAKASWLGTRYTRRDFPICVTSSSKCFYSSLFSIFSIMNALTTGKSYEWHNQSAKKNIKRHFKNHFSTTFWGVYKNEVNYFVCPYRCPKQYWTEILLSFNLKQWN